jgi:carboxypeptidase family protein/TonB-dependent receptor-like protein
MRSSFLGVGVFATLLSLGNAAVASGQEVSGLASDESTGRPIPGARVVALTAEMNPVADAITSPLGAFALQLPSAGTFHISVVAEGFDSFLSDPLVFSTTGSFEVLVSLNPLSEEAVSSRQLEVASITEGSADLIGEIGDIETKRALEAISVEILDMGVRTLTNSKGYFSLPGVPPGIHVIEFTGLGMLAQQERILVEAGKAYQLTVRMSADAIPIEGITVRLRSRPLIRALAEVQFRMSHNQHLGGIFLTREDLELRGGQPFSQILSTVPGVRVRSISPSEFLVRLGRGRCTNQPGMWVDGSRVAFGMEPLDLNMIPSFDIEIVEIYRSAASLPDEFGGSSGNCGAISIWTKRGG